MYSAVNPNISDVLKRILKPSSTLVRYLRLLIIKMFLCNFLDANDYHLHLRKGQLE
jgi:hypothetical protein